jgi:hypothetical protein
MKQQINEIKKMQLIAGLITESEYQESLINENDYDDMEDDDDDDFDITAAFKASPEFHSYEEVLDVIESYEDDEILEDFKAKFPEGKDISREDYSDFTINYVDDMSEVAYIQTNWISISDPDIYDKAGMTESQMDEDEIKEEEKGLPFLLAKTWLDEYNGNIQFAVRTEEIIGFLYNLRDEEFKQYKEEIERMYLPYKKAKDAFEKLWDEASVYPDKDLKN